MLKIPQIREAHKPNFWRLFRYREERIGKLGKDEYQEVFGVKKRTFEEMLRVLEAEKHEKGGSPPKLSVLDKLVIVLQYYREYRAMRHIAFDYGVVKSTISGAVSWAERTRRHETLSASQQRQGESTILPC